jgi:hypothetical protein
VAGSITVVIGTLYGYSLITTRIREHHLTREYGPIVEQAWYNLNKPDLDARKDSVLFPARSGWNESMNLACLLEPFDKVRIEGRSEENDKTNSQSYSHESVSGPKAYKVIMDAFREFPSFRHTSVCITHRKKAEMSTLFLFITAEYAYRKGVQRNYKFIISGKEFATIPFNIGKLPESDPWEFELRL